MTACVSYLHCMDRGSQMQSHANSGSFELVAYMHTERRGEITYYITVYSLVPKLLDNT